MESSYSKLKYFNGEYGEDNTNIIYQAKKIDELKAKSIKDIPKILVNLNNIFENMNKSKFTLTDKVKLKYIYNIFPPGFESKFEFKENKTSIELCYDLKYNISMKSYVGEWNNKEETSEDKSDDPMDRDAIDAVHKGYNKFTKTNNNIYNNNRYSNNNKPIINKAKL